jgi:hypothetical protein
VQEERKDMNGLKIAAIMHRLSTVYRAEDPRRREGLRATILSRSDMLREIVEQQVVSGSMDHVAYAHLAYAYAHLELPNVQFFAAVTSYLQRHTRSFPLKSLSMVAWAYAKIGGDKNQAQSAFTIIAEAVADQVSGADAQIISHICWAFATLEVGAQSMFQRIAEECLSTHDRLERFSEQELCVLAWSFGRQHHRHDALFQRIGELARKQMRNYTPQHLQMLSLGFGELGIKDDGLLDLIAQASMANMHNFTGTVAINHNHCLTQWSLIE